MAILGTGWWWELFVEHSTVLSLCCAILQTLHGMLEREIWKQLPMIPDDLPSIRAALDDPSVLAAFTFDTSNFAEWVANGNPWHMQAYGEVFFGYKDLTQD